MSWKTKDFEEIDRRIKGANEKTLALYKAEGNKEILKKYIVTTETPETLAQILGISIEEADELIYRTNSSENFTDWCSHNYELEKRRRLYSKHAKKNGGNKMEKEGNNMENEETVKPTVGQDWPEGYIPTAQDALDYIADCKSKGINCDEDEEDDFDGNSLEGMIVKAADSVADAICGVVGKMESAMDDVMDKLVEICD